MLAAILRALLAIAPPLDPPSIADRAWRMATDQVREAIDAAYLDVDPGLERPWWRAELYLICARESRCGQYGLVGLHGNDAPTSDRLDTVASLGAWAAEVKRGRLDPESCELHSYMPREWGTRGMFGGNAARGVARLEQCVGPSVMDDPTVAAWVAAQEIAACESWAGDPGQRRRVKCSCSGHTRLWVGAGVWEGRSLWQRTRSIRRQCGTGAAGVYLAAHTLGAVYLFGFALP